MNRVVAAYPDKELPVIIDNPNTHKPKSRVGSTERGIYQNRLIL